MKSLLSPPKPVAKNPAVTPKGVRYGGRQPKLHKKNLQTIYAALRKGMTRTAACAIVKVSLPALSQRMKSTPKIRQEVEAAEGFAELHHVTKLHASRDTKDSRWWLSHNPTARRAWGDNMAGGVNVQVGVVIPQMPTLAQALDAVTADPQAALATLYPSSYGDRAPRIAIAQTSEVPAEEIVDAEVRPLTPREVVANLRRENTTD